MRRTEFCSNGTSNEVTPWNKTWNAFTARLCFRDALLNTELAPQGWAIYNHKSRNHGAPAAPIL